MKTLLYFYLICLMTFMSGCSAIEGIFKAGVWVGVLVVVGIIALILWLVSRAKK
jgi:hypothetical protein